MAQTQQVVGPAYPFLTIRFQIRGHSHEATALLDTGFSGDLAIPSRILSADIGLPDARTDWELADGSAIDAPLYLGTVEVIGLPAVSAGVIILGEEHILGRGVLAHFKVTLDHGRRVVVEL